MSHIGKKPITIPSGVTVQIQDRTIVVKGTKGELTYTFHPTIDVTMNENMLVCEIVRPGKKAAALWGTTRARIANCVEGVSAGFKRELEMHGVGYRGSVKGNTLELSIGFSHPVIIPAPEGITFAVEKNKITIEGINKEAVGQTAATIRDVRPPEPYKGKGIRYVGEHIKLKVGKVVGTTS